MRQDRDLLLDELGKMSMIKGFIHVYGVERGQQILAEQIHRLRSQGLWDVTEEIRVFSVGPLKIPQYLIEGRNVTYRHLSDPHEFERPTLQSLYEECCKETCRVWYIHTKGASWTTCDPR